MPAAIADRVWALSLRIRGAIDPRTPLEPDDLAGSGIGLAISADGLTAGSNVPKDEVLVASGIDVR